MPDMTPPELQEVPLTLSIADLSAEEEAARHQRDASAHLANERTFLAWSLTAIVIIGSGVALARTLIALNRIPLVPGTGRFVTNLFYPTSMGLVFLGAGALLIVLATCRYLSVHEQIMHQRYRPSTTLGMTLLIIVLLLTILMAGFLLQLRGSF